MGYHPKLNSRERVLLYGPAGAGKSYAAYSMAKQIEGHVFCIDNDYSMQRTMELDPPDDVERFTIDEIFHDDWTQLIDALSYAVKMGTRDDLLIIDSMTPTWQAVQEWYTDEIFGTSIDEFFLAARKDMKGGKSETFDGWKDWSVINKVYGKLYRLIARFPGHVILTAELDKLSGEEDKDVTGIFGPYRTKPRGQKRLAHTVNTVAMLTKSRAGEFKLTIVKDRGREHHETMVDEEFSDFFTTYMVDRKSVV